MVNFREVKMSENKENNSTVNAEQDLNDQMIVRREKLDELRSRSLDPFQEVKYDISHSTKDVKDNFDDDYQDEEAYGL